MIAPHKYWKVYEEALSRLLARDLGERCTAAGYGLDGDEVRMTFLGRMYALRRRGSTAVIVNTNPARAWEGIPTEEAVSLSTEQQEEHLRERILILHYLDRASGAPLSARMVGFDQLIGARFYGSTFRARVELPLVRIFAPRPALLAETAGKLGGAPAGYGDGSILLHPFPRISFAFVLWQGDDEVPSNGKVLWDASAEDYLSAEDLTVLGETIVRRLTSRALQSA